MRSFVASQADASDPVFPGEHWLEATPESQGIDPSKLDAAIGYLADHAGPDGVKELVIVCNGYLIWEGTETNAYHTIHSCTKTFTSTVLGLLIEDGKCTLDTSAAQYLPSLDDRYSLYSDITLRHLVTMTSGYKGNDGVITDEKRWGDPIAHLTPEPPRYVAEGCA